MARHNDTGKRGEDIAESLLVAKGYTIHFRNWRTGRREVDIIASFDNQWVFVEVKTRSGVVYGFPEDSIGEQKKAFMREAAEAFLWDHQEFPTLRYDIVSIVIRPDGGYEWRWFEDAFW